MEKTPITIFSGYLGSGKTTILMNSLRLYETPQHFALIKNEYGNASVDGALARMNNLAVKELVNGCLCCILVGSLNEAVNELIDTQHPQRIVIEASGNALPFPIILELKKNDRVYVDGVISVVDCVNFEKVKDTSMVAREQAKYTDLIIFNKINLVDTEKLYRVKEEIFGINPDTVKVDTADGVIDPRLLFGINHADQVLPIAVHHHEHELETFTYVSEKPFDRTKLDEVLNACNPAAFYRIKGVVDLTDAPKQLVNGVFGRLTWQPVDTSISGNQLIFIGRNIKQYQQLLNDYLHQATVSR